MSLDGSESTGIERVEIPSESLDRLASISFLGALMPLEEKRAQIAFYTNDDLRALTGTHPVGEVFGDSLRYWSDLLSIDHATVVLGSLKDREVGYMMETKGTIFAQHALNAAILGEWVCVKLKQPESSGLHYIDTARTGTFGREHGHDDAQIALFKSLEAGLQGLYLGQGNTYGGPGPSFPGFVMKSAKAYVAPK